MTWSAVALAMSIPVHAVGLQVAPVCIIIANDSASTMHIVEILHGRFPSASVCRSADTRLEKEKASIVLAIGPAALRAALAKTVSRVVISLFTSSQAYRAIVNSMPKVPTRVVTAIYAEPAPSAQMQLIARLYRRPVRVAVLVSGKTAYWQPLLLPAAARHGISLSVERVDADQEINRSLNRIAQASAILAIPDDTIYNVRNIRGILTTAYRHDQPVIGFSAAFVAAGALASTISDPEDILVQLDEIIASYATSGRLPAPQFPKYFRVVVNDNVARSLNVVIDDSVRTFSSKPEQERR